jgi:NAD(P)-dependent dehydrogenase (short-subunit alcohol dehydrogenase family)
MKIAIVTGGSRGLGKNTVLHMAEKNIGAILTYRDRKEDAASVVSEVEEKGGRAVALQLDVGQTKAFPEFVRAVKEVLANKWQTDRFDFLVNNAGAGMTVPFTEMTEEQFDSLMNVHFRGAYFLTQKLLSLMNDGGRIINLSSGTTRITLPGYSVYAPLKGAVEVWTRYLAKELGPRKIAVNVVAPGAIETDFNGGRVRDNKEFNKMIAGITALGRVGVPDDIGPLITAMCLEETRWVNGQRIEASGGQGI